jgi:hypothetical protein
MNAAPKLLDFFRREFAAEERSGFSRLSRVPDTRVMAKLACYRALSQSDKLAFADCCAHWSYSCYGFVVDAPRIEHRMHPFFEQWKSLGTWNKPDSVPVLRAAMQEYKCDMARGIRSHVSREEFEYASSIQPIKAAELRKRARAALKPFGYYKIDELGYYCCRQEDREFRVHIDYGGLTAQFRYVVVRPEFKEIHPLSQFRFERALGFGSGDWDFIVEENVDDVFVLFAEVVAYSYALPDRIRAEAG